jgi:conjugative relaxase-like TrwC/TraI family protein
MRGHNDREYYSERGAAPGGGIRTLRDGQLVEPILETDAASYALWVDGVDPVTGEQRGRAFVDTELRKSPKFMEHVITVSKELSVLAGLDDEFGAALDRALDKAADDLDVYASQVASTRTRRDGRLEREANVAIQTTRWRHLTSRADDPHRHIHWQVSTKVQGPDGKWLALDSADMLKHLSGVTATHQLSIAANRELRELIAARGYTAEIDAKGHLRIPELGGLVDAFSTRRDQIAASRDNGIAADLEARWRTVNPDREPSRSLLNIWDHAAWNDQRPTKAHAGESYEELQAGWRERARELGIEITVSERAAHIGEVTEVDVEALAAGVVAGLGSMRSTWSQADLEAVVRLSVMRANVVGDFDELVADVESRALALCDSVLDLEQYRPATGSRHLTSEYVRSQDERLETALMGLASVSAEAASDEVVIGACMAAGLNAGQTLAAQRIASMSGLEVVIGPAGTGKTTMAGVLLNRLAEQGRELRVGSPSKKGAAILAAEIGVEQGDSVAKWLHSYGYRWNEQGERWRLAIGEVDRATGQVYSGPHEDEAFHANTVLLVDEAGMLGVDDAVDLMELALETGASMRFMGDPRQLGAIGRGGVLPVAQSWVDGGVHLDEVHRFVRTEIGPDLLPRVVSDEAYAEFSLRLRDAQDPSSLAAEISERSGLRVHATHDEAAAAIADEAVEALDRGESVAVTVATKEQARQLSEAIRELRVASGAVDATRETHGKDNVAIGRGDVVTTRRNDRELNVANRDSWTVTQVHGDGSLTVRDGERLRKLDVHYVNEQVELGYASTGHGQQGVTATRAIGLVDGRSDAQGVYVAATRGREENTLHVIAPDRQDGKQVLADAIGRTRGDQGLARATEAIAAEAEREGWAPVPIPDVEDRQTFSEWRSQLDRFEAFLKDELDDIGLPLAEITYERREALLAQAQSDDPQEAERAQSALEHADRVAADNERTIAQREDIETMVDEEIAKANERNKWRKLISEEEVQLADDEREGLLYSRDAAERLVAEQSAREATAWEPPTHGIEW